MYGFVNSALEKLIRRRFGSEKWEEIRQRANVELGEQSTFLVNTVYRDQDTYIVIGAACEVLGLDAPSLLEMFGEQFLVWCKESGYAKTLQLLGRSLQDFLTNLDALHDHLSIIYPQMDAPSFRCTEGGSATEFHLHYYSSRDGLESIVKGIVKTVAREFYGVEVSMSLVKQKGVDASDHSMFYIKEIADHHHKRDSSPSEIADSVVKTDKNLISAKSFCKAFPFHIIFNHNMEMLQMGNSLAWILPDWNQKDHSMNSFFTLERPRMKLSFLNIISHINTIFIVRLVQNPSEGAEPMRLRGQMIHLTDSDCILFLCSPRVRSIYDLDQRGLYLSDIPIHDATRGLLMMSQTATTEFHHVVQLEEVIGQLNMAQRSLEEEKGRMRDLLHQMLPISVADSLMAGQMIEAERFESVTILFSDIFGFTKICGKCEPIQVVSMLNKLYTMFDTVVGLNRVYKVETIGDAYMVVGGLPERSDDHAECVANQALDMMHYCEQVIRPDTGEPLQIRIGIHSGAAVAGIVGCRMPRYCLFGNTVNIASRAEANGEVGKIQITEATHKILAELPNFEFEVRGPLHFKNVDQPMMCYFLKDNTEKQSYFPIEVPEEITYDFMQTNKATGTPPQTPFGLPQQGRGSLGSFQLQSPTKKTPMLSFTPQVNVIDPTPGHTPIHTPETTPPLMARLFKNSSCPFSGAVARNPENDRKISVESFGTTSSMTPSESDNSILSNEDTPSIIVNHTDIPRKPMNKDDLQKYVDRIDEEISSTNLLDDSNGIEKCKSDSQLLSQKKQSLDVNGTNNHKRSPSLDTNERSFSLTSEDSFDEDISTSPTSPNQGSVRFVRPRTSSLRDRVSVFESITKNRRTGLSTTSYLQGSSRSMGSFDEGNGTQNNNIH